MLGLGVAGIAVSVLLVWHGRDAGGGEASFLGIKLKAATFAGLTFLVSALGVAWAAVNLTEEDEAAPRDAVAIAHVREIEQLPPNPVRRPDESKKETLHAIFAWFAGFGEARIVIDQGREDGVRRGDWFATVSHPERIENLPKSAAGNLQDDLTALVRVVSVYPEESIATLEEWAYDAHLRQIGDIPIPRGEEIDLVARGPVVDGQALAAVPREEKRAKDQVDRWFARAREAPEDRQELMYEQAQLRAEDFLKSYPNGFFAGQVLWTKASAQFELGRYAAAARSWRRFRDEFPFHPSARAADDAIRRAETRLRAAS